MVTHSARLGILAIAASIGIAAEARGTLREWKSAKGGNTLVAEFVSLEKSTITLKRKDGKVLKFDIAMLSEADQKFAREKAGGKAPSKGGENFSVFDQFRFKQSRDSIEAQLKKNKEVQGGVPDIFMARTGLNGLYFVSIEGERYDLFFEWDDSERLKEIVLQSSPFDPGDYDTALKKAWSRLRNSFSARYGKPSSSTGFPKGSVIVEGAAMSSDIWQVGNRHFYLGTGRLNGKVSCVLRCGPEPYVVPPS